MKSILILIATMCLTSAIAQQLYKDSIYNYRKVDKETSSYVTTNNEELKFDFYRNRSAKGKSPLIVCVHGGGFGSGARDTKGLVYFCKRMAARGYSVASVSYRLTMKGIGFGCDISPEKKLAAIDSASTDVLMAVNEVVNNNSTYNIDTEKIILLGSSAGAEAVLNLAYNSKFDDLRNDVKFAGVVSLAGAVTNINMITTDNVIPTQMIHGTGDALVPYNVAAHHFCDGSEADILTFYGPSFIAPRLKGMNAAYYLLSVLGGTHGWAGKGFTYCFNDILDFIYNDVVAPTAIRQTEQSVIFKEMIE